MSASTINSITARLPELHGEKQRRWIERAFQQAFACSMDVHGHVDAPHIASIRIMALSLWTTSAGKPEWGKLDVDHCIELAGTLGCRGQDLENFALVINTFVCFLNKFSLIDNADAVRLSDHLEPLVEPVFKRLLAEQPAAEASLN